MFTTQEPGFTTRPELTGDLGMVAGTHYLAVAAGMAMLEDGGNAFDAAATAGFVLQVVEPHQNGPGGEMPAIVWSEDERAARVVCGQGVMPAAATVPRLTGLLPAPPAGPPLVPGTGLLPAPVPGAVGGWLAMLARWGTRPLAGILAPAIGYAEHGFPVYPELSEAIATVADRFRSAWPTSAEAWLPGDAVPAPGQRLRRPRLAATYRRLLSEARSAGPDRLAQLEAARRAWYSGFVAEAIDAFCAARPWWDDSGEPHAGLLTGQDLAAWHATIEDPVTFDYRGHTVCKTGPWGQGPVFLQQLALLAGLPLDDAGPAEFVHAVVEAGKLAFADREAWYGDPDHTDVPLPALLSPSYNDTRRALIGDTASLDLRPGAPDGRTPALPDLPRPAPAPGPPGGDTCHLDVADRFGNLVSATPSGGWLHGSPDIPELGFCLSTRGQMCWLTDGLPATLRPGTRPRTTLSPSLALRDGRPWLAFGTPGGDMQDQWSLHLFLAIVHHGLNLAGAIDAPAFDSLHAPDSFHPHTARPGVLRVEDRFGAAVLADLAGRGHLVEPQEPWSLGRLSAVSREPELPPAGFLRAAANPRGGRGYAAGR